jgi:hypothetical protein
MRCEGRQRPRGRKNDAPAYLQAEEIERLFQRSGGMNL